MEKGTCAADNCAVARTTHGGDSRPELYCGRGVDRSPTVHLAVLRRCASPKGKGKGRRFSRTVEG